MQDEYDEKYNQELEELESEANGVFAVSVEFLRKKSKRTDEDNSEDASATRKSDD